LTTSPAVDKDFMCDEELDIKPIDKKTVLFEKKLSEKKLPLVQMQQTSNQVNAISQPASLMSQQRYVKKVEKGDKKTM
jgi:hypothetical protein